jgi:hypothetical protein
MTLVIYLLTPFTMTHSIPLFQGFRIIQTRMMLLAILHGLRPNPKLKSILEGCTDHPSVGKHPTLTQPFFQTIFPASERLHSFHPCCQPATQILLGLCHAQHPGPRIQPIQKIPSAHNEQLTAHNLLFAIGKNTTTSTFGLPSLSTQTGQTSAVTNAQFGLATL